MDVQFGVDHIETKFDTFVHFGSKYDYDLKSRGYRLVALQTLSEESVSKHTNSDLNSPGFVTFITNLTHFRPRSDAPV